jgi:hypothetical protein
VTKRKSVDDRLVELDEAAAQSEAAARAAGIAAALRDRHCRVVARAAKLAADALLYELVPGLIEAYARFLENPVKADPNCRAKKALIRALVALECDEPQIFLTALRYRQLEPVWGGSVDTAVDVRSSAAMGLVASAYPRALVKLAELLNDAEAEARIGAVRAIACGNPREAELLLRAKIFFGDSEPAVIGEAFAGLLAVEPEESLPLVARYLAGGHEGAGDEVVGPSDIDVRAGGDQALREWAALALGESRLEAAVPALRAAWNDVLVAPTLRRMLARAAALNRSRAADDWLLELVESADDAVIGVVVQEIAAYHRGGHLNERVQTALADRGRDDLGEVLRARTRAGGL